MGAPELQYGSRGLPAQAVLPRVHRRQQQLEQSGLLNRPRADSVPWYRFRLAVEEVNYATRRTVELQTRPP
jgi:hypothetical protein